MEELASSSDSDTNSEEYSKEVEEELYSVLHHNDFSQGIPPELLDKYSITTNRENEFVISLKPAKDSKTNTEDLKKEIVVNDSSSVSSSEDDIVVVETNGSTPALTSNSSKNKVFERVVIEEDENSDGSSSIEIIEMSKKRKHSGDSESSVISLSSDGENLDFSINTTGGHVYDSDGNVSDVIEKSGFKWATVASPTSWTKEMRKYYNSPCNKLRYFDHKKIRQGINKGGSEEWYISHRDRYPEKRWTPRCDICRQTDHIARNCPKQEPTCHMCGVQGHTNQECPNSICLQCGTRNNQYSSSCRHCMHMLQRPCFNCNQTGHESRFCPEKWREFHSTVDGPVVKTKPAENGHLMCCNCGATNHAYEACNQNYLSNQTKTLSAYDWLHGKRSHDDWRYNGFGPSPRNWRSPSKRQRFSHEDSFGGNRSNEPDFARDSDHHLPPFFQTPIPSWYLNRTQKPRKSKSLKRKDRRRKNGKNKSPGINFR
uniref:Zinc finger CCHC domain-containing protein 7 n=1 Tax=Lygus hesperus TaxID=30085 RepID=A0A0A9WB00_LYGHE